MFGLIGTNSYMAKNRVGTAGGGSKITTDSGLSTAGANIPMSSAMRSKKRKKTGSKRFTQHRKNAKPGPQGPGTKGENNETVSDCDQGLQNEKVENVGTDHGIPAARVENRNGQVKRVKKRCANWYGANA